MHLDKRYVSDRLCILKLNLIINGLKFCINVSRIVSASGISFIYISFNYLRVFRIFRCGHSINWFNNVVTVVQRRLFHWGNVDNNCIDTSASSGTIFGE